MKKTMVGDVFAVVIDEIGEVTFRHEILSASVRHISEHETAARALAAVMEMLDICHHITGVSATGFHIQKAMEQLLRDFDTHADRLREQEEFSSSAHEG